MTRNFPCEFVSWGAVHHLSTVLAKKINIAQFKPDIVVTIARGGYIPARLLCDFLHLTDLSSFRIAHYTAGAEKKKKAKLVEPLCRDLKGKRVLLVDDISDTGDTLKMAREHLAEHNAGVVRFAVLHHKKTSTVVPDYYAHEIIKWRWIIYPWAVTEDLNGLIKRLSCQSADARHIAEQLRQEYGLRIRQSLLEKVLSFPAEGS